MKTVQDETEATMILKSEMTPNRIARQSTRRLIVRAEESLENQFYHPDTRELTIET